MGSSLPTTIDIEYLIYKVYYFFASLFSTNVDPILIPEYVSSFTRPLYGISLFLFLVFAIAITFCKIRLHFLYEADGARYAKPAEPAYDTTEPAPDPHLATRWDRILTLIDSPHPNDWRVAIMEADIILGDILTKMGYKGESIGEILKGIEASDFQTLQAAWDAHKVRNEIAHNPAFELSQREAKRVIDLYRHVFSEFYYV